MFFSKEKRLKMIWTVRKGPALGYLVGTAHFFPYSFKKSLEDLTRRVKTILLEGPLDDPNMKKVVERGVEGKGAPALYDALDEKTIIKITQRLRLTPADSRLNSLAPFFSSTDYDPLREMIQGMRPWMAFFSIWTHFLKDRGWNYSVDLDALKIGQEMGKEVIFLEKIEEQLHALDQVPFERIVAFLKQIDHWEKYSKRHADSYLNGEIPSFMNTTVQFPTRCPAIIENRDSVFFERMKPYIARGEVIAFLGVPHIPGVQKRLQDIGYQVEKYNS
ncbi:MAG: TraB/GumN family protein [Deltaproteobacteria bacterium]|nr:TraB/GumN family protein [Deltaproteobacteria bacterium]